MEKRFKDREQGTEHQRPKHEPPEQDPGTLPKARVKRGWKISPVWIVPLLAAAFVGWLIFRTYIEAGPKITIRFKQGKGIEKGKTPVKYRGVKLGEVDGLKLSKDQQYVEVQAQLDNSAAGIARAGSKFWIVHPQVSMSGVKGLNTIVSGDYIQVEPGNGTKTNVFTGLEKAPVVTFGSAKALRLVLLTGQLRSISPGTDVLYRGIKVGETTQNELGPDAQTVQIHVYIYPQFTHLVRKNSKFWNAGGVNLNLGMFGAEMTAHSVETLITGALAFATPDKPDDPAPDGTAFRLYDKAQDTWLNWEPRIKLPPERNNILEEENQ